MVVRETTSAKASRGREIMLRIHSTFVPSKAIVLSVGSLFLTAPLLAAPTDITAITFTDVAGPGSTENDVQGAGKTAGIFDGTREYDLKYTGDSTRLDSLTTTKGTYLPTAAASNVFRRTNTPNADIVYYVGSGGSSSTTLTLDGKQVGSLGEMFAGNNLNVGVDNMFANRADKNGNFTNIERVDFVFKNGLAVNANRGFSIIERGNVGDHDSFGIVAITGIDRSGNPTAYGNLVRFDLGEWGNVNVVGNKNYIVLRRDDPTSPDAEFAPSFAVTNGMGGTFVPLTDLAAAGQTIYGYSLVGGDVTSSGSKLVDWQNPLYYPTDTLQDNTNRDANGMLINKSPGGLDPTGTLAMLYELQTTAVPEPGTMSLVAIAASVLGLGRRRST